MQDKTKEKIQGERSDFSKNQQLYGDSKNKDVQNPEKRKNPSNHSEEDEEIDTTKPTWHHGEEVEKSKAIDPLGSQDDDAFDEDDDDFDEEMDFENEDDFEDEDEFSD